MAQKHSTPLLTPREYKDGRGWYVEATGDGGIPENVGDFGSDSEAKDWIARLSNRQLISKPARNDAGTNRRVGQQFHRYRPATSLVHASNDASRASTHLAKASRQLSPFASA